MFENLAEKFAGKPKSNNLAMTPLINPCLGDPRKGDTTEEVSIQQKAKEILAAIEQCRQQQRQPTTTSDNNGNDGREEDNTTRRRVETPRRPEEDTTAVTEMAIAERQERGVLQLRRRSRRRFVVATTTVLACLLTVTTSLSHIVFTTLPFVAQQLQLVSSYTSWRQVERLQMIYNYSCQAGDYYQSYYRTTLEFYNNMTATPQAENIINVEETTATTAARTLPTLRAPKVQPLDDWRDVKDYLVDNLVKSHLYNFDYKEASCTVGAYHGTFNELRLPPATTPGENDDSESEEEIQSMIETHNMWSPYHYTHPGDNNPVRTYYLILEEDELKKWETTGRDDLQLSTWKSTTSKVYQHLHLFEHPRQNPYVEVALQRNLLHYYKRDGSRYLELENHSDALRDTNKFTTPTVIVSGCNYDYIIQMLTPHFYSNHLVDTTVVSGPDYVDCRHYICEEHVQLELREDNGVLAEGEA